MSMPALLPIQEYRDWRRRVARAFSRAAPRYAQLATAQEAMGEGLWQHLPIKARTILDLGCGPGDWSAHLAARYPDACVLGLDLAPGMLREARRRHGQAAQWLCGDAGALPLAANEADLVFSNLAIQWCPDLDGVMRELHRVLRPGGRVLINTLGPGTLFEVAQAWSRFTPGSGLLGFKDTDCHRVSARLAGFHHVQVTAQIERFFYPDFNAVMASIKGVGAQTARPGARLNREDLKRAEQRYEKLRESAGLPVSYRRLTLVLER
ncbi:methyltransferase domain-containing protein [Halomonas sp. PR-M31]|uniref:methyltransferase domain-containing protein n=1 Tax=Halomonas sp. PR-M31 TaxID=1471202 RepID=UPI000651B0EF|nr:methyltransferase domain-containing protein [Halomonas sp. PR-M31]